MSQTNTLSTLGSWDTAANWSLARIPNATDDVVIPAGGVIASLGPSVAVTINSLTNNNVNIAILDLHNLTVSNATVLAGGANPYLVVKGGHYNGAVSTTGYVDFSQGPNYPVWGAGITLTATDSGNILFYSTPPTVSAPSAAVFILGPYDGHYSPSSTITANYLFVPATANFNYAESVSHWTVNKSCYLDGIIDGQPRAYLTLSSTAKDYYLGNSISGGIITVTDNRTGTAITPADVAQAAVTAIIAQNPQLTQSQIQTAMFGASGKTLALNSDGSANAQVTAYGAGADPSEVLFGVYDVTFGNDGAGHGLARLDPADPTVTTALPAANIAALKAWSEWKDVHAYTSGSLTMNPATHVVTIDDPDTGTAQETDTLTEVGGVVTARTVVG